MNESVLNPILACFEQKIGENLLTLQLIDKMLISVANVYGSETMVVDNVKRTIETMKITKKARKREESYLTYQHQLLLLL